MSDSSASDRRPLAFGIVFVVALYAVLYRFVPYDKQAYLIWPFVRYASMPALDCASGRRLRLSWPYKLSRT